MTTTPLPTPAEQPAPVPVYATLAWIRATLAHNAAGHSSAADVVQALNEHFDRDVSEHDGTDHPWPRDFSELSTTGLLWLINRQVFHPWGYALALDIDPEGVVVGWRLVGDGTEPWNFKDSTETEHLAAARRVLGATDPMAAVAAEVTGP